MRRYSPSYYSPPKRGYGGRGRSPPRRGYSPPRRGYSPSRREYGGYGRRKEQNNGSLLVRNIPLDCRPEELRVPFERFGVVRDVYIPKDYFTGEPRGFAFVQFVDPSDATEAQYHMNGQIFVGREISVVVAAETRKRPEEMRRKVRIRGPPRYGGRGSPHYNLEKPKIQSPFHLPFSPARLSVKCRVAEGRSRSRSVSHSRSPRYPSGSRGRYRSGSYTPSPRRRDNSRSPDRRHADQHRSPVDSPRESDGRRSYSPARDNPDRRDAANGYDKRSKHGAKEARDRRGSSPMRGSRSPPLSRSQSADAASPARIR